MTVANNATATYPDIEVQYRESQTADAMLELYLTYLERRREVLIIELSHVEGDLVKHGRVTNRRLRDRTR